MRVAFCQRCRYTVYQFTQACTPSAIALHRSQAPQLRNHTCNLEVQRGVFRLDQTHLLRNAQKLDREVVGVAAGAVGPVEAAVRDHGGVIGLAMGAYGEASDTVEQLLEWCAGAAAEDQWERLGYTSMKRCRAAFLCAYRDRVSVALYRAKAEHLFMNVRWVEGAEPNEPPSTHGERVEQDQEHHSAIARRWQVHQRGDFRPRQQPTGGGRAQPH